ncbi:Molybdopterin molybdenumtransferase [hydrothermal vent metagenome]|uniref:Molybdopterin molybdenumtransferase n=1 Tax=hydrothermal vent metagenome TaxID=652676 RepID=A0A3B1C4T8_9ZZZZ
MKLVSEAKQIIDDHIEPATLIERTPITRATGRILAGEVKSDIDLPPFNRVSMDGYAVISSDGPGEYEVIEYVPAGAVGAKTVTPGHVTRIMTGAPLPDGADAVIQVEKTGGFVDVGEKAEIKEQIKKGKNFSPKGEDVLMGDVVLTGGVVIEAPEVATLATVGADPVEVFRQPTVAILSTGDELVAPNEKPKPGQIRDSNRFSLFSQVALMGVMPTLLGVARDNEAEVDAKIAEGLSYDFLLVSGGVSAGDKDFVPGALAKSGYDIKLYKVRVKPGKPLVFGVADGGRYVFGVPGNPVSGMVIFELFIKPAIKKRQGLIVTENQRVTATLSEDFKRKKGAREEYIPVKLKWEGNGYTAERLDYHGSAHIHAMTHANALLKIPIDTTEALAGWVGEAIIFR